MYAELINELPHLGSYLSVHIWEAMRFRKAPLFGFVQNLIFKHNTKEKSIWKAVIKIIKCVE